MLLYSVKQSNRVVSMKICMHTKFTSYSKPCPTITLKCGCKYNNVLSRNSYNIEKCTYLIVF